jgi:hypothetical protein
MSPDIAKMLGVLYPNEVLQAVAQKFGALKCLPIHVEGIEYMCGW